MSQNTTPYLIPKADLQDEILVNKSRFICSIKHCGDAKLAKAFIDEIRGQYPDASHNCYAFVSSRPENSQAYGFSDDGEPSGTAGRPMLAVLQGSNVGEICAVVTRYFGGIKLGTGGLQRAYGNSVRQALIKLETELKTPTNDVQIHCGYQQVQDIEHHLSQFDGVVISQDYGVEVVLIARLPIPQIEAFKQCIIDHTAGRVIPKWLKPE